MVMVFGRPLSEIPTSLLVLDKRPISKAKHATSLCKHHSQGNDQTCLDHLLHLLKTKPLFWSLAPDKRIKKGRAFHSSFVHQHLMVACYKSFTYTSKELSSSIFQSL